MSTGDALANATDSLPASGAEPSEERVVQPQHVERPDSPQLKRTSDSFLYALVESSLPSGADASLGDLFGQSMPRAPGGGHYAVSVAGRFSGDQTGELLAYAQKSELSGALVVVERDDERVLYLSKGRLIGSQSTVLFEHLGRLLYQAEVVSHEASGTLVDAEETLGAHSLLLWISSAHLDWAIERRMWEVVTALNMIKRGHFMFVEGEPSLACPTVDLEPMQVAYEGARRHAELRQGTPRSTDVYHPSSLAPAPPRIERELRPIEISPATLDEILQRIREADGST